MLEDVADANNSTNAYTSLLVAGAVSVGVHAGLAPMHLHEWPPLGAAFIAAATAGAVAVAGLTIRPASPWPPRLLALLFVGLIASYSLTRLITLAPLDPTREPLDLLGAFTCAVEAGGFAAALSLTPRGGTT